MDEVDLTTAQSYRLNMIETIQKEIELEREKRMALIEKYNKGCTVTDTIQHTLIIGMIICGTTSLGATLSTVGIPVAIGMDVGAVVTAIQTIANNRIGRYLATKMNKHEKIRSLAENKLSTISGYISKAMEDDLISDQEYSRILTEYEKYLALKDEIRMKTKKVMEEQKNTPHTKTNFN